jgi:hypothetical protein
MPEKNVSELLNIIRAGAGIALPAEHFAVDDVLPLAMAAGEAQVEFRLRGALHWRAHDLVEIARVGKGMVIYE